MDNQEFLQILKNIYGTLTYEDWVHAKEYVKIEMSRLQSKIENEKEKIYKEKQEE